MCVCERERKGGRGCVCVCMREDVCMCVRECGIACVWWGGCGWVGVFVRGRVNGSV